MKAIVTGSSGFIGKNLVERLKLRDVEVLEYDVKDGRDAKHVFYDKPQVDVIYHLACINQMRALFSSADNLLVNAHLTKGLADYAAETGARFVYTSTASVYGNAMQIPTPAHENPHPETDYAVAKLAGEHFVKNSGSDYAIYRLSNVYGPYQTLENPYCGVIGRFIESAIEGKPLKIIGDGHQTRDFTFVHDVVDILVTNETHIGDFRTQNVGSGRETSILELAMTISRLVGNKTEFEWIEKRPIDGIRRRALRSDFKLPTKLTEGLEKTIIWAKNNIGAAV